MGLALALALFYTSIGVREIKGRQIEFSKSYEE